MLRVTKKFSSNSQRSKQVFQTSLGLFALNQYLKSTKQENECGGILAYISTANNEKKNGIQFQIQNAHFLQQLPYYQCGLAILNQQSKTVQTMKFTSKGHIAEPEQLKEEEKKEEKKKSGVSGTSKEEGESDEDAEAKLEQLAQRDYGYRERAIVLPEDDCFFKMENELKAGVSKSPEMANECGISILHSRIADLNLQYDDA